MAKTLIKLYDDDVDLEEFILVDEEDVEEVVALLEEYRKSDEEYNIDGFFEVLDANAVEYEAPPVEKVYF
jgi:hypothetical protein